MKNIVILTGAGISAESGIRTFRDQNGLWENHDIYEVASPEGFRSKPDLVYEFYNQRRTQLLSSEVRENLAHHALGRLEKEFDGDVHLITQNVDDLHERGGSTNILHMHGELLKAKCQRTQKSYEWTGILNDQSICDCCQSKGNLRPDIVWFGENVYHMDKIQNLLFKCDLFISVGTSGQVYPAAQFVSWIPNNALSIEVNLEKTQISNLFDKHYLGEATKAVSNLVNDILNGELQ